MLRRILKSKRAQQTAEYAILISLVVGAVIAMQTYAQRALQGRVRAASKYMASAGDLEDTDLQYEPYYLRKSYEIERGSADKEFLDNESFGKDSLSNTTRAKDGFEEKSYSSGDQGNW